MLSLLDSNSSQGILSYSLVVDVVVWKSIGSEKRDGIALVNSSLKSINFNRNVMVKLDGLSVRRGDSVFTSIKFDLMSIRKLDIVGAGNWELNWFIEVMLDVFGGNIVKSKSNLLSVSKVNFCSLCSLKGVNLVKSIE
jgi:hypothetical protein